MPGPGDDERIDIDVVINDMTSPEAEKIDQKIKNIGDESESTDKKVEDLGKQTDKTGRSWRRFGLTLRKNRADLRNANKDIDGTRRKVKGLGDETVKADKKIKKSTGGMRKSFGGLFKFMQKGLGPLMFGVKFGFIADGVGFLATALKGLGAAGYAAVAGLTPLVGLLGIYPGLISTAGQAFGVLKLATAGLGDAIAVMGDPKATVEEYNKATKNLHHNQILFAQSVATTKDEWIELRKEVGGRFFKNVGPLYLKLTQKYQPLFNKHLSKSADIWNVLIHDMGDFLASKAGMETMGNIMESNNTAMERGSGGMLSATKILLYTLEAVGPMMNMVADDWTRMTGKAEDWIEKNPKKYENFFTNSYKLAESVGNVLGDVAVGLFNIGKLSMPLADWMGKNTEEVAEQFRMWTESKDGRKEIRGFFRDMKPVIKELSKWVPALFEAVDEISVDPKTFVKWSRGLRKDVLPMVTDLFEAFQGFAIPALNRAGEVYGNLKESGATGGIGRALNFFATGIEKVAEVAADLPDAAKNLIGFATGVFAGYKILNRGPGAKIISALTAGKFGNNGIQKVWVMNPGFGTPGSRPGSPGVVPGGGPGSRKPGIHKAPTRTGRVLSRVRGGFRGLGLPGLAASVIGGSMMSSDDKETKGLGQMLAAGGAGSMFGPWGAGIAAGGAGLRFGIADAQAGYKQRREGFKSDPSFILGEYATALKKQQDALALGQKLTGGDKTKMMMAGGTGNPMFNATNLEASQAALRKMNETFEKLTGFTIPEYKSLLNDLPKDVQTKIETPGAFDSNKQIKDLLKRFDMTPEEKQTALKLLGADESMLRLRDLKAMIDALQDKTVKINIERNQMLMAGRAGGAGKAGDGLFTGGNTYAGKRYMVGEMGPEAWVSRSGSIKMLGLNGPEFITPGAGAVVNAQTTRNPFSRDTDKSPDWAVNALRKATGAMSRQSSGSVATATPVRLPDVKVTVINPKSDVDVERAVEKALRKIIKEQEERS